MQKCDRVNQLLKLFWNGDNSLLENPWSATVKNCTWSSEVKTDNTVAVQTAKTSSTNISVNMIKQKNELYTSEDSKTFKEFLCYRLPLILYESVKKKRPFNEVWSNMWIVWPEDLKVFQKLM